MNFCMKCGARLEPGSKFCIKCGTKIAPEPVPVQGTSGQPVRVPNPQTPNPMPPKVANPQNNPPQNMPPQNIPPQSGLFANPQPPNALPRNMQPQAPNIPPNQLPSPGSQPMPIPQPPVQRLCTKCGIQLNQDVLFCPTCGTKNYVFQQNKMRKGELLVTLENCNLIKLQILKNPGTLFIYDDRVFFRAEVQANNIVTPYPEILSVTAYSAINANLCFKLSCTNGRSFVYSISNADADFFYYVINLITDYRY